MIKPAENKVIVTSGSGVGVPPPPPMMPSSPPVILDQKHGKEMLAEYKKKKLAENERKIDAEKEKNLGKKPEEKKEGKTMSIGGTKSQQSLAGRPKRNELVEAMNKMTELRDKNKQKGELKQNINNFNIKLIKLKKKGNSEFGTLEDAKEIYDNVLESYEKKLICLI